MYELWRSEERVEQWRQETGPLSEEERQRIELLENLEDEDGQVSFMDRIANLFRPAPQIEIVRERGDADLISVVESNSGHIAD